MTCDGCLQFLSIVTHSFFLRKCSGVWAPHTSPCEMADDHQTGSTMTNYKKIFRMIYALWASKNVSNLFPPLMTLQKLFFYSTHPTPSPPLFHILKKLNTSLVWVWSKTQKLHYGLIEYFCNWTTVDMVCVNQGRNLWHVRLPRVKCVLKVFHKGLQYNWKLFYIRRFTARLYVFAKGDICDNCFVDQMCVNIWYQYYCRMKNFYICL